MKKAREQHRHHAVRCADDGSFRIENVLAGTYDLNVHLQEPSERGGFGGQPIGSINKEIIIEEAPGGVSDEPLDLGTLTIQLRKSSN